MNILEREPVLLGAALTVTADGVGLLFGANEATQAILHGIVVAWVAWVVRTLSIPQAKVDAVVQDAHDAGRVAAIADVQSLAAQPAPVKRPAKKTPAKRS